MKKSGTMAPTNSQGNKYQRGSEPAPSLVDHFAGHRGAILSIAFHPNLDTVFTGSSDCSIMTWNYKNRSARALKFEGHTGPVNDIAFSKTGELMASASEDHTVRIWVPIVRGEYISIKAHSGAVKSTSFSPTDSSIFATASADKSVKIWSVQRAKTKTTQKMKIRNYDFVTSYAKHTNWVNCVRFSTHGNLLTSCSDDKTIRVFDLRSREIALTFNCYLGKPTKVEFNPCGEHFIGASTNDKSFLLYDARGTSDKNVLQCYENLFEGSATDFSFHPSGDFAVCVSDDKKTKILDLIEGRPIFTLYGPREGLNAVSFKSDGSLFATGGKDKELHIWEPVLIPHEDEDEADIVTEKENEQDSEYDTLDSAGSSASVSDRKEGYSKSRHFNSERSDREGGSILSRIVNRD